MNNGSRQDIDYSLLASNIKKWGQELGFQHVGITDIDLSHAEQHLLNWLNNGFHGEMHYMSRHGTRRSRPAELVEGTIRVISVRLDYGTEDRSKRSPAYVTQLLKSPAKAQVSCYAVGKDYHKLIRRRLQRLAKQIETEVGLFGYRAFTDSAPVLEKALAEKAGLGWIGKHSNLLHREAGSWFFLGELYTDLPLPIDTPADNHCSHCSACLDICPTQAIIAPYQVDARRCISYLTIELQGTIPTELRPLIGNRIYGCDDCQWICPWNRFAQNCEEPAFAARNGLDNVSLIELFDWDEQEFNQRLQGSPIRRIGHHRWLRNIAVALGNCLTEKITATEKNAVRRALERRRQHDSVLVREHVEWALQHCTMDKES